MKFSDPFNRVSCRDQKEYQQFLQQLQQAGIDSEEKANELLRRSKSQMLVFCLAVVACCLAAILVWPQLAGIVLVFGVLIVLWLIVTMARGQRMTRQFIQQKFPRDQSIP
jgi:Flp pilus assembly protein TadB